MRILSFNIGQRGLALTLAETTKRGTLIELLESLGSPEIACFQEIKTHRTGLSEHTALAKGYSCYFGCHRISSNYSGVLTCVRDGIPVHEVQVGLFGSLTHGIVDLRSFRSAVEGAGALAMDTEGRVLLSDHGVFVLANVYLPALGSSTDPDSRVAVKAALCEGLASFVVQLQAAGRRVVVCGDLNIAHRPVDHCDASTYVRRRGVPFESDNFRMWLSSILLSREQIDSLRNEKQQAVLGTSPSVLDPLALQRGVRPLLVDSFRCLHPLQPGAYSCWNAAASSRATNYGTRIDYVLVDAAFCFAGASDGNSSLPLEANETNHLRELNVTCTGAQNSSSALIPRLAQ